MPRSLARPREHAALGVLALCFALNFTGRGLAETFVVLVLPLVREFEADRAAVLAIPSLAMLASGLVGPFAGRAFDRLGPRVVFAAGLGLLGLGLSLAPHARSLWHLHLALGLPVGIAVSCLGVVPNAALLSRWFGARLSLAMAVLYAAGGTGVLALVPLTQWLVERVGWRATERWFGLAVLALLLPVLLLPWRRVAAGRVTPTSKSAAAEGPNLRQALRHPGFWGLFCVFLFTSIGMSGLSVQVVAYLVEAGFAPLRAAFFWGFSGLLLPLGMLGFGWLDGRIGRRPSVLLSYAMSLGGIALLWLVGRHPTELLVTGFVLLFGGTVGSRGPLITTIAMTLFRGPSAGTIFGTITLGAGTGAALGVWMGGALHDWSGGYDWGLGFAFASVVLGMLPFLIVPALRR